MTRLAMGSRRISLPVALVLVLTILPLLAQRSVPRVLAAHHSGVVNGLLSDQLRHLLQRHGGTSGRLPMVRVVLTSTQDEAAAVRAATLDVSWDHVRFMPKQAGSYTFTARVSMDGQAQQRSISFLAVKR